VLEESEARERAATMLADAGIVLTPADREAIEVADFGLGDLERYGLQIVVYVNTERVCAKELVMFPGQTCPEHRHPPPAASRGRPAAGTKRTCSRIRAWFADPQLG